MILDPETWKRLYEFAERHVGVAQKLCPTTELFADLGLEAFSEKFSVEVGDFDFDRYFGSEGFSPIDLFVKLARRHPPRRCLTLSMLAKAAELGTWKTKTIEDSNLLKND